jgi:hypothetical protein
VNDLRDPGKNSYFGGRTSWNFHSLTEDKNLSVALSKGLSLFRREEKLALDKATDKFLSSVSE